jgi:hypothetical protein
VQTFIRVIRVICGLSPSLVAVEARSGTKRHYSQPQATLDETPLEPKPKKRRTNGNRHSNGLTIATTTVNSMTSRPGRRLTQSVRRS